MTVRSPRDYRPQYLPVCAVKNGIPEMCGSAETADSRTMLRRTKGKTVFLSADAFEFPPCLSKHFFRKLSGKCMQNTLRIVFRRSNIYKTASRTLLRHGGTKMNSISKRLRVQHRITLTAA